MSACDTAKKMISNIGKSSAPLTILLCTHKSYGEIQQTTLLESFTVPHINNI